MTAPISSRAWTVYNACLFIVGHRACFPTSDVPATGWRFHARRPKAHGGSGRISSHVIFLPGGFAVKQNASRLKAVAFASGGQDVPGRLRVLLQFLP
jgi:hypothetical protein